MHFPRRAEEPRVVPVRKNGAVPASNAIDGARQSCADRHHAAPERDAVPRLDDQVRMIALERVVREAKVATLAAVREGTLDLVNDPYRPERGNV